MTMDYRTLKGRPAYPFETIGVAVAFSPRLEGVLGEAKRLVETFGARLILIHAGKRTPEKDRALSEMCARLGLDMDVRRIWQEGDPVSVLLATCKSNSVDLLVLGALRRENVLRYYLGSVARGMSRRAKCSLLLLVEPKIHGTVFQEIVVSCIDHLKSEHTLKAAVYFAKGVGAGAIHVVREVDQAGFAMAMSDDITMGETSEVRDQLLDREIGALQDVISRCQAGEIQVSTSVIPGRPGFAIRQYTENAGADLLVINSPDSRYGIMDRIFTHDMEHILEHMPCNMLIVHSRIPD